jgi:hypothetical protein
MPQKDTGLATAEAEEKGLGTPARELKSSKAHVGRKVRESRS